MWHFAEWQRKGNKEDWLAWKGLAGFVTKEEIISEIWHSPKSDEHKQKLSIAAQRPRSDAWKASVSESYTGEGNPFYGKTHSEETKAKLSEIKRGRKWWTNGETSKMSHECPGPEWRRGRCFRR